MSLIYRELQIEPTNRCNLRCVICNHTFPPGLIERDMSLEEFKSIIEKFPGLESVFLQGLGEPFMNPELLDMAGYASARGLYTYTTTNMTLVGEELLEKIFFSGLKEIRVSIDTADPMLYTRIKSGGNLEEVVENIKMINRERARRGSLYPILKINAVGMKDALSGLSGLVEMAHELNIAEVSLIPLVVNAGAEGLKGQSLSELPEERVRLAIEKAISVAKELKVDFVSGSSVEAHPAGVGMHQPAAPKCRYSLYIQSNGELSPCCNITRGFGNVLREAPEQIFATGAWKELSGFIEQKHPACSLCTKYAYAR